MLYINIQPNAFSVDLRKTLAAAVPVSSSGSQLDVQSSDSELFAALGHILSGQHGSIWRRLISVCLYLHPTSHAADGFPGNRWNGQQTGNHHIPVNGPCWCFHLLAGQVSDMDEGVVERSKDVTHAKHVLSFGHLRTQADHLLLLLLFPFTRSHCLKTDGKISRSYSSVRLIRQLSYLWNSSIPASSKQTPNQQYHLMGGPTENVVFYVT